MTPLSTALRALAAEPAPKGTSKSTKMFVTSRFRVWADAFVHPEMPTTLKVLRTIALAAVEGSNVGSWERGMYERGVAALEAHLAAETGAAS